MQRFYDHSKLIPRNLICPLSPQQVSSASVILFLKAAFVYVLGLAVNRAIVNFVMARAAYS